MLNVEMASRKTEFLLFRWAKPHHYILLMVISTIASFVIGYSISVDFKKVHYLFPYISEAGTTAPASCYFGLFLNLSAIFASIIMYFRHSFLEKLPLTQRQHNLNDISLFLGGLSAFGMMLVANFQFTAVISMHFIGAFLTFILGNVYCFMNNYFTYITITSGLSTKWKFYVRCILSFLSTVGLLLTFIGANIADKQKEFRGINLHWTDQQKGYVMHLVSVFAEWVMGISFVVYFLTFYADFKTINASLSIEFTSSTAATSQTEEINL